MAIQIGFSVFPGGSAWLVRGDHEGRVITDGGFHHEADGRLPEELGPADQPSGGDLDALGEAD